MITITKTIAGVLDMLPSVETNCWVHMMNPEPEEIAMIAKDTGMPESMLKVALDAEESAHIDYEDDTCLVVVDIPFIEKENGVYVFSTVPIGILYNKDYFVTVCLKETSIIKDFYAERIRNIDTAKKFRLMLQILYRTEYKYLQYLKRIDKTSMMVQNELHKSIKNKEIIELLDLEKSLVYFSTSLSANDRVLNKIQRSDTIKKYEEDNDFLDDVITENKQAIEMCSIYRDILSGTMDAFASIISNNLNLVMRMLTLVTIIISIPTLIASFWGMNVAVPFQNSPLGFLWVVAIAIVVTIIGAIVLSVLSGKTGRNRRRK